MSLESPMNQPINGIMNLAFESFIEKWSLSYPNMEALK